MIQVRRDQTSFHRNLSKNERELPDLRQSEPDDDIIPIEDLTPRTNVKGGRKIILGEILPLPE